MRIMKEAIKGEFVVPITKKSVIHRISYRDIGRILGVSHEQVRLIEKRALHKLRKSYRAHKYLREYYKEL